MFIVLARHQYGIYLYRNAVFLELTYCLKLTAQKQLGPFFLPVDHIAVTDPGIYPCANNRVNGIYGYGHIGNIELCEAIYVGTKLKPIGGETKDQVRELLSRQFQCFHCRFGIGKRVSGPGDTCHFNPWLFFEHYFEIFHGLSR